MYRSVWINGLLARCPVAGLLFILFAFSACSDDDDDAAQEDKTANRTVLVYMMAENSMGSNNYPTQDIEEMLSASASIPDNDHLIVFLDDASGVNMPGIYEIMKATSKSEAESKLVMSYDEEVCSTDPDVLAVVLSYVKKNYPAQGYGLVMWSHGSGWISGASRSIGIDNESNSYSNTGVEMEISDLANVLESFGVLDFLYFDACFMQCVEVAYELRNAVDYVIGSPAEVSAYGAKYDYILSSMFATTADISGMVNNNFSYYNSLYESGSTYDVANCGSIMSAVKCSELETLAELSEPIISAAITGGQELSVSSSVQSYRGAYTSTSYPDYYDLNGLIYSIATTAEYEQWLVQFEQTVPYRVHTDEWYSKRYWYSVADDSVSPFGGISLYIPKSHTNYANWNDSFRDTDWYKAVWTKTGW